MSNIKDSVLQQNAEALEELSGSWYFYEPRHNVDRDSAVGAGDLSLYSTTLAASLGYSMVKVFPVEAPALISARRAWQQVCLLWLPEHCGSGDYCGATRNLSNTQVLLEKFAGRQCREVLGPWGFTGVAIDPRYLTNDLLESLQALEDYPVIDEMHLASLEIDLQSEAWEQWAEREFRLLLGAEIEDDDLVDNISGAALWDIFEKLRETTNIYWESEGASQTISLQDIMNRCPDSVAAELISQYA